MVAMRNDLRTLNENEKLEPNMTSDMDAQQGPTTRAQSAKLANKLKETFEATSGTELPYEESMSVRHGDMRRGDMRHGDMRHEEVKQEDLKQEERDSLDRETDNGQLLGKLADSDGKTSDIGERLRKLRLATNQTHRQTVRSEEERPVTEKAERHVQRMETDRWRTDNRRAQATLYMQNIEKYGGERNARTLEMFLESFEDYAEVAELSDREQVKLLKLFLEKKARIWYAFYLERAVPQLSAPRFPKIAQALRREFLPIDHMGALRAQWHALEIRAGLEDYLTRFKVFLMEIPGLSEEDVFQTLTARLDAAALHHLRALRITTSDAALEELTHYAAIIEAKRGRERKERDQFAPVRGGGLRHYVPTNAMYQAGRSGRKATINEDVEVDLSNYNNFEVFPRLTTNLRDFLSENNGCFYCRELNTNHSYKYCPQKSGKFREAR